MVTSDQLQNKSAANMELRPFLEREILLGAFNIYVDMLQCLSAVQFLLNGKQLTCKPLETFDLPPEYEVQFDGKRLVHHIMVKRGQMLAKEWLSHYNFPQPQARFDVGTNYVYAIHPVIDRFLFTESGNIAVANVDLGDFATSKDDAIPNHLQDHDDRSRKGYKDKIECKGGQPLEPIKPSHKSIV